MTQSKPKKVVMTVNNEFTTDYRVYREASALVRAGYDVTVLCVYRAGLARAEEKGGVHIRRVLDTYIRLPFSRQGRAVRLIWRKALLEHKADIYHAHDRDTLDLTVRVAKRFNVPCVYDSHEFWPDKNTYENNTGTLRDKISEWVWRRKERIYAPQASAVIMTSDGHARGLQLLLKIPKPTLVRNIPEFQRGNDPEYLHKKLGLSKGTKVLVYVGNIQRNRGLEQIIAALRKLPSTVHLVIIGYGPYRDTLKKSVAQDLVARVHYIDPIPFEQIIPTIYSADVGVAPFQANCFSHRYVMPNKPFEYMMAELPVVVSDLPELRRLVASVGYGETCKPDDPSDIARAISRIILDPDRARRYSQAARQASQTTYRWDVEQNKLLDVYRRIVP